MWESLVRWETLWYLMLCLYVPACIGLIVIVLLQKGKGVSFAGAFGIGAGSDAIFGPRATKSLPQKLTYAMAATFLVFAFVMSMISGKLGKGVAPGKLSESAVPVSEQTDLSGIEGLGSALTPESNAVTVTPAEPGAPAATAEPAPAEKAAETQPASPEPAPAAIPPPVPEDKAAESEPAPAEKPAASEPDKPVEAPAPPPAPTPGAS